MLSIFVACVASCLTVWVVERIVFHLQWSTRKDDIVRMLYKGQDCNWLEHGRHYDVKLKMRKGGIDVVAKVGNGSATVSYSSNALLEKDWVREN